MVLTVDADAHGVDQDSTSREVTGRGILDVCPQASISRGDWGMKIRDLTLWVLSVAALSAGAAVRAESSVPDRAKSSRNQPEAGEKVAAESEAKLETATFGAGCFWCSEAIFQRIKGVESVVSGYSGGHVKNPSYEMVHTGLTGHAEVVQITFDPEVVSYDELLEIFWKSHDPTKLNKQGVDKG